MTAGYSLRHRAVAELESIWLKRYRQWGAEHADQYLRSLLSRFTWLAENPRLGKQRADIQSGYYCFPEGMHLIFYTLTRDGSDIIGIPPQHADTGGDT